MKESSSITPSLTLGEAVLRFAAKTPDKVALVSEDTAITYADLASRAKLIAAGLCARSTSPNPIAILQSHSVSAVTSIIGALFARCPYVVIDPTTPATRVKSCLDDASIAVVLTGSEHVKAAREIDGDLIVMDVDALMNGACLDDSLPEAKATEIAAIYYTSGSTGQPKGIEWDHAGIIGVIGEQSRTFQYASNDCFSLMSALSFTASIPDLYSALLNGATASMVDMGRAGLAGLAHWIDREQITVFHPPVTLLRRLLDTLTPSSRFESVRVLILSGDRLERADVERARRHFSADCIISHQFAMSEVGVVSRYAMRASTIIQDDVVPVGSPVPGKSVYLVDDENKEVVDGEEGEIVVESAFMSRGYLNRVDLNEKVFQELPGGIRRCRTGDRGRRNPDGVLEFLGRRDELVKIRGFRVELGAIETALNTLSSVLQSAVSAQTDSGEEKRIVAYIRTESGSALDRKTLRSSLAEVLPDYMIPSLFVQMDSFPMTATGKLDRQALPVVSCQPASVGEAAEPDTELEQQIAKVWRRVLGISRIAVDDDFFELGGDSLKAVTMLSQIEAATALFLPPSILLEAATISQLAAAVVQHRHTEFFADSLVAFTDLPHGRRSPFFCVHGSGGNVLNFKNIAVGLSDDQPFYGLQARGVDGKRTPRTSIVEMARAYIEDMRHVQPSGPYIVGGYSGGGVVAFEIARQLSDSGEAVALVVLIDTLCPARPRRVSKGGLARHVKGLLRDGPDYVHRRFKQRKRQMHFQFDMIIIAMYRKLGKQLLPAMQARLLETNLQQSFRTAAREYAPHPSAQATTIFLSADSNREDDDNELGWTPYLSTRPRIVYVPGDHDSILKEPNVRDFGRALQSELVRAQRGPSN